MSRDTSRFPTGKISFDQEKCLWRCRQVLTREMDSTEMMKEMVKRRVVGEKDQRKIRSKPTNTDKNQALLDIIMNRTNEGFLEFVRALDATGHKVAYDTVLNALASESKNTLQKLVDGGKASEFTTGAVFQDSGSEKSPTHQEVEVESPPPRRQPIAPPPPPPPVERTVIVRHTSVEDNQAKTISELRRDLETAKHETIGLREENFRIADTDKQKTRQIERLIEMVDAGREKIAKLVGENRHLKHELEGLRRDYENAKKEIRHLRERLEKLEPRTARDESRATRTGFSDDKISQEVAKQYGRMKSEILDEIKKDQRSNDDLIPVLDHQNRRILSYQLPPAERITSLPMGIPATDTFGTNGFNGISGIGNGRRTVLGTQTGNSLLNRSGLLNGTLGMGKRNDLGYRSLELGKPGDLANNLGMSKRFNFGSVDDGLAERRNAIWNDAVQTGMLNKQRNGTLGTTGLPGGTLKGILGGKAGKKKGTGIKALENGKSNDVWNGAVVSKTLQAQPSWLYKNGDIPLWFHHVDHSDKKRNYRNEALIWERSPRIDEPYTFRWSVDTHGKKLLEGFITERRDRRDHPGKLPRRHKALTLKEV
ncbi:uncharacterized protein [Littorina saxatilis]|uniref:CARD domain-containing protein n=1 Tax=Littorina saxatilis TaxID=31220 RepID=A0AAN9AXC1_9CAEN